MIGIQHKVQKYHSYERKYWSKLYVRLEILELELATLMRNAASSGTI